MKETDKSNETRHCLMGTLKAHVLSENSTECEITAGILMISPGDRGTSEHANAARPMLAHLVRGKGLVLDAVCSWCVYEREQASKREAAFLSEKC